MVYHLAVDIGASSGRHILGWLEDGIICTEEIYRFENNLMNDGNKLIWDIDNLVSEVKNGIKKCAEIGKIPDTVAIDTWGVDYVLLDADLKQLLPVYCYRDGRTAKTVKTVEDIIPQKELYKITGIQKQNFNTIYQLYDDKISGKLDKAEHILMIPSYLSYCLTGKIENEYTNATTSGMVSAKTHKWDDEIIDKLGYPKKLFKKLLKPGDKIGNFTPDMQKFAGFDAEVIFCPSHDTASAVAACPLEENGMYISSGTWSLMGIESKTPVLSEEARLNNFANEGGIEYRFRILKNYMGMWLLQNIRRNLDKKYTYDEMMEMAMECGKYYYIDVNAEDFVAPVSMIEAVRKYLNMPDLPIAEVINSVYHSLARSYKLAVEEFESVTGTKASAIHIVGGGSKDKYLNSLTAQYTGKTVSAGPVAATALGNLLAQIMYKNKEYSLQEMRDIVKKSFNIEEV